MICSIIWLLLLYTRCSAPTHSNSLTYTHTLPQAVSERLKTRTKSSDRMASVEWSMNMIVIVVVVDVAWRAYVRQIERANNWVHCVCIKWLMSYNNKMKYFLPQIRLSTGEWVGNDVSTIDLLAVELTHLQRLYYYECCTECSQQ